MELSTCVLILLIITIILAVLLGVYTPQTGLCFARSASVICRSTGQIIQEKVPFDVRWKLGLLFHTIPGRYVLQTPQLRRYLISSSERLGMKYDGPKSVDRIPQFISDYGVDLSEVQQPLESFTTLNSFFYRKLKIESRPISVDVDAVQPCDCRLHVFPSSRDATRLWIKGKQFSIPALIANPSSSSSSTTEQKHEQLDLSMFTSSVNQDQCAMVLCRLAPTDYHRFHCPVDCVVGEPWQSGDELYSVKDTAITSPINVLTDNKRVCLPLFTKEFGTVLYIMVGATHVGSIVLTVSKGQHLNKGDEIGYFAYGGSTIVLVFAPNTIRFDRDLLHNSCHDGMETLVRMGTSLGTSTSSTSSSTAAITTTTTTSSSSSSSSSSTPLAQSTRSPRLRNKKRVNYKV